MGRHWRAGFTFLAALLGCVDAAPPFAPDMAYEPFAEVGGFNEGNEAFQFGQPWPWLVDSTTLAYSDGLIPGRLVVAEIPTGEGWTVEQPPGEEGPGGLGGSTPWLSTVGDTVKLLTPRGRLSARLVEDGTLLYDSLLSQQNPGQIWAGIARNARVTIHVGMAVGGTIELRFESPRLYRAITIDTIQSAEELHGLRVPAAARGDLIAYILNGLVYTRDGAGQPIALRQLPWEPFTLFIDRNGRVWVQVYGHARGGYNLMLLDRRLNTLGHAVIPGYRDAYGDYVLSSTTDRFDVPRLILSRLKPGS